MAEFGAPRRSATQDANAGVVDAPANRTVARQQSATQVNNASLNEGVARMGSALGDALGQFVTERAENIVEKKQLAAAVRQGSGHAVNTIDQANKRTGWEEGVFGQDVGYRAAQQRAVENSVNANYLEQLTTIDEYAGESQGEYAKRLGDSLDKLVEPFQDDPETKQKVTNAWLTASAKLTAKQSESHYAYNQQQQRATVSQRVLQTVDTAQVEAQLASPEEMQAIHRNTLAIFSGSLKPDGMSDVAYQGVLLENLDTSLRQGNIGMYNMAKQSGWAQSLNPAERAALEQSINAYDTKYAAQLDTLYLNYDTMATGASSPEEAIAQYEQLLGEVNAHSSRASGSDRSQKLVAGSYNKAVTNIAQQKSRLDAAAEKAAKKAAELEDEQKRVDGAAQYIKADPQEATSLDNEFDFKKSELATAADSVLLETVGNLTGDMDATPEQVMQELVNNPNVTKQVAQQQRNANVQAPITKTLAQTFVSGFGKMVDENGQPNEQALATVKALVTLRADNKDWIKHVSSDVNKQMDIVINGVTQGKTSDMIQAEIKSFKENKGKRDSGSLDWRGRLGKDESKQQYVAKRVAQYGGPVGARGSDLSDFMQYYDDYLTIHNGDFTKADQSLRDYVQSGSITYGNQHIVGGSNLNDITNYDFKSLMDGVQRPDVNLMSGVISAMVGDTRDDNGDPIRTLGGLKDWNMYTRQGQDGVWLDSSSAKAPVYLSRDVLERMGEALEQRDNFLKLQRTQNANKIEKKLKANQRQAQAYQRGELGKYAPSSSYTQYKQ